MPLQDEVARKGPEGRQVEALLGPGRKITVEPKPTVAEARPVALALKAKTRKAVTPSSRPVVRPRILRAPDTDPRGPGVPGGPGPAITPVVIARAPASEARAPERTSAGQATARGLASGATLRGLPSFGRLKAARVGTALIIEGEGEGGR